VPFRPLTVPNPRPHHDAPLAHRCRSGKRSKQVVAPLEFAALSHLVRSAIAKARRVEGLELVGVCHSGPSGCGAMPIARRLLSSCPWSRSSCKLRASSGHSPTWRTRETRSSTGVRSILCVGPDVSTARSRSHTWRSKSGSFGDARRRCRSDRSCRPTPQTRLIFSAWRS
jgi:hypothetical protein